MFVDALRWYDSKLKSFYGCDTEIDSKLLVKIHADNMMKMRFISVYLAWKDDNDISQIIKVIDAWLVQFAEYDGGYI